MSTYSVISIYHIFLEILVFFGLVSSLVFADVCDMQQDTNRTSHLREMMNSGFHIVLGPVHTYPDTFESGYFLLRI